MTTQDEIPGKSAVSRVGRTSSFDERTYIAEFVIAAIFLIVWWLWAESLIEHVLVAVGFVAAVLVIRRMRPRVGEE